MDPGSNSSSTVEVVDKASAASALEMLGGAVGRLQQSFSSSVQNLSLDLSRSVQTIAAMNKVMETFLQESLKIEYAPAAGVDAGNGQLELDVDVTNTSAHCLPDVSLSFHASEQAPAGVSVDWVQPELAALNSPLHPRGLRRCRLRLSMDIKASSLQPALSLGIISASFPSPSTGAPLTTRRALEMRPHQLCKLVDPGCPQEGLVAKQMELPAVTVRTLLRLQPLAGVLVGERTVFSYRPGVAVEVRVSALNTAAQTASLEMLPRANTSDAAAVADVDVLLKDLASL